MENSEIEAIVEFPKVCLSCKETNLTEDIQEHLMTCPGCGQVYCVHFASSVDPSCCKDCCHDVEMTVTTEVVKREHYNEETDTSTVRTHKYRSVKFTGLDWLFFNRKINTLTDLELSLAIEYHQGLASSMLYERDKRKAEYFHRNAGKHITIKTSDGNIISTTKTTTTVKKTQTTKSKVKTEAEIQLAAQLDKMLSGGLSIDQILGMLKK